VAGCRVAMAACARRGRSGRYRAGARSVARRSVPTLPSLPHVEALGIRVGGTLCRPPSATGTRPPGRAIGFRQILAAGRLYLPSPHHAPQAHRSRV
jgi:hypothetical protein